MTRIDVRHRSTRSCCGLDAAFHGAMSSAPPATVSTRTDATLPAIFGSFLRFPTFAVACPGVVKIRHQCALLDFDHRRRAMDRQSGCACMDGFRRFASCGLQEM